MTVNVLFVCLGNICRSPMAEAVFGRLVAEAGLAGQIMVDSAGTGSWHLGEPAHAGTRHVLVEHGIQYRGRARQVTARDMADERTYIVAMDSSNVRDLEKSFGKHPRLTRLLDHAAARRDKDVPDPYYDGNFEGVYDLVVDGSRGLLAHIRDAEGL